MDAVHESDGWGGARVSRRKVLQGAGAGVGLALVGTGPARATPATLAKHHAADVLHGWVAALYRSQGQAWAWPTMAARFYGLAMLAGWEAVVDGVPNRRSLGGRLNGLGTSPVAGAKKVHWPIAANAAIGHVAAAAAVGVPDSRTQAVRDSLQAHRQSTHTTLARGVSAAGSGPSATTRAWPSWAQTGVATTVTSTSTARTSKSPQAPLPTPRLLTCILVPNCGCRCRLSVMARSAMAAHSGFAFCLGSVVKTCAAIFASGRFGNFLITVSSNSRAFSESLSALKQRPASRYPLACHSS